MKLWVLVIISTVVLQSLVAQNFLNGDLNGTVGISATPTNWAQVADTDPVSQASAAISATSDVTSTTGPLAGNIVVNPYSGGTCVTGLHLDNGSYMYHEGIQQTVAGLTIGAQYRISFWQTVSKQSNVTESTGSWTVYGNSTLLGTSAPTTSALPYGSTSRVWEKRYITFTANTASITFKFLPLDDDPNILNTEGVRMAIDSVELDPYNPLPIELISFQAVHADGMVQLTWATQSETNNDYFTIEKSTDGIHFEELKRVAGAGNSNCLLNYAEVDNNPGTGVCYYRLKQTDYDGMFQYSQVVVVNIDPEVDISIYPNPVMINGHINLVGEWDEYANMQILNTNGFIMKSAPVNNMYDLTGLPAGIYFLQVNINNRILTRRFIIQ